MSQRRRAELAAAGNTRPWSTLTGGGLNRSGTLAREAFKPARPADTGPDAETVAVVVGRDQGQCVRCGRYVLNGERGWDWSIQHRRARQGRDLRPDTNTPPNLILLCGSATTGCHGWVETNRNASRPDGWAIRQTDVPASEPVTHYLYGRVLLTADGSWTPAVAA
ncbi:hypothetical protein [Verrucosispora sp. WMMC514]|uniref:hypothetical protein n=1 Tax=Verrucosispora sp. WMMC514 TaxID=3015156 RepID=UPI00248AA025|nr:hypothetical protein [Verrucosispora sp. WMMC514]WBB94250.1 hypothetical protein O7597_15475 [Verrucosispora sp. WMMC514]